MKFIGYLIVAIGWLGAAALGLFLLLRGILDVVAAVKATPTDVGLLVWGLALIFILSGLVSFLVGLTVISLGGAFVAAGTHYAVPPRLAGRSSTPKRVVGRRLVAGQPTGIPRGLSIETVRDPFKPWEK